jgi:predicted flap endonuclease-1-like 5' DNA nuclease
MNDFINSVTNNDFVNTAISYVTDSFMSIFILGVLTGWLIEWIFYNLFWKQRGNKDVTDNKAEVQSSDKIVEDNKEPEKEQQPEKTDKVEKKQDVKQAEEVDQQEAKSKDDSTESEAEKSEEKQVDKQDAEAEKPTAEESEKDQTAESKDEAVEAKAEVAEKKASQKASQKAAEKPAKKEKKASKPAKADDFTKLYGVGPSIAKSLKAIGVDSFKQLSESNSDELVEKLIANGTKVVNKGAMKSWAEQAKLADADDFDGLKAFQDELKKG